MLIEYLIYIVVFIILLLFIIKEYKDSNIKIIDKIISRINNLTNNKQDYNDNNQKENLLIEETNSVIKDLPEFEEYNQSNSSDSSEYPKIGSEQIIGQEDNRKDESEYKIPDINILENSFQLKEALLNQNKIPIGTINNKVVYEDLSQLQNVLIGGTAYSGKTSYLNSLILSILLTTRCNDVKLVIIDTKKIDMPIYNGIPNLLYPVITDIKKAILILMNICNFKEKRENILSESNCHSVDEYNRKNINKIPRIIVIIDDYAMLSKYDNSVNNLLENILQTSYKTNINIICSTTNPTTSSITKAVKSYMNTRMCFKVPEGRISRFFIDSLGAEKLSNNNSFYYKSNSNELMELKLIQVEDSDIELIINDIANQNIKLYNNDIIYDFESKELELKEDNEFNDPMYNEIYEFAIETGKISASLIQRRFRIGYNRAARIIDLLDERGVIGPQNGSAPREVLIKRQ